MAKAIEHKRQEAREDVEECFESFTRNLPTGNLNRETLADIITSLIKYKTGSKMCEFEGNELRISQYGGNPVRPIDVLRGLSLEDWYAVREVEYAGSTTDEDHIVKFA